MNTKLLAGERLWERAERLQKLMTDEQREEQNKRVNAFKVRINKTLLEGQIEDEAIALWEKS